MLDPINQPLALPNGLADGTHARTALALQPTLAGGDHHQFGPPGLTAAPTVSSLLHALRRRWLLALTLAVAGACLGVFGVLTLIPAQYVAHARVQVASRAQQNLFTPSANEEPDFLIFKASLAAFIKSPLVVNAAVNQVKDLQMIREQAKPVAWLETALKTDYLLAPEILRLALSGDRPDEVAKILNAVTDAFLKEMELKEKAKRQLRLEELKENQRMQQESLHQKRRALRARIKADNLDDPAVLQARYQAVLVEVGATKKTLLDKHLEQINAQEDVKGLQATLKHLDNLPVSDAQIDDVLKSLPVAQQLYLAMGEVAKNILIIQATATDPENLSRPWKAKEKDLIKQMNFLRQQFRPELEKKIRMDTGDKMKLQLYDLQNRINSLKKQEENLAVEIQRREEEANRLKNTPMPLDVVALRDEIGSLEAAQNKINEMIAAINAEPGLSSRVALLQRADVPSARDFSKQSKLAGVAGLGMFGMLLFGVSWWEFRSRRISAADEVVKGLNMSLVGTLPELPNSARRPVPAGNSPKELAWQSQLSEAVDGIRTMLLHAARSEGLQVLMITSAMGGEGKTSLASQLAASLARAWRKTLLVDGDLRKPAAHTLFGLPQEPGFSEVLRGEVDPPDAIRPTPLSRLWLMPAGHFDSHAVQALAQEGVRAMFQQLKEQYDFIIVDSCPVLPVNDSLLLAQHVDAVIFSILRDVSRVPTVYSAQQRLSNLGIRTLGAVVIGDNSGTVSSVYQYQAAAK